MTDWMTTEMVLVADLVRDGFSDAQVAARVAGMQRLRRGVYVARQPVEQADRHRLQARAVIATHDRRVVLSHVSAALMWNLPIMLPDLGPVTISRLGDLTTPHRRHHGVWVCGSVLSARDVRIRSGMRVTAPERTVLDCARYLPFRVGLAVADAAAHAGLMHQRVVERGLSQMKGWKGVGRAREVIANVDPQAESPGETWTRDVLRRAEFRVESQFEVRHHGAFVGRVDFRIAGTPVLVEFDGSTKYGLADDSPRDALWREKLRHDALVKAGFEVVRLTWTDLARPADVRRMIKEALTRAESRGFWSDPSTHT
jgi:very-short-patch-repair endonuclease